MPARQQDSKIISAPVSFLLNGHRSLFIIEVGYCDMSKVIFAEEKKSSQDYLGVINELVSKP